MKFLKMISLFALIGTTGFLASCGESENKASCGESENKLRVAYDEIIETYPSATAVVTIGADDSYITTDTNPYNFDDYYNASYVNICEQVVYKLGMPASTWQLMISTRAIDGTRTDTKNGVFASWTYHPDSGLSTIFTLE